MSTSNIKNTISLIDADGNERHVRVFGNASDPHFCGKDICQIMEIENHKDALQKMVNEFHKKELKNLLKEQNEGPNVPKELGCFKHPNSLGSIDLKNLSYHDGRLVVLSEPGVYDLLNGSRKDKNKKFLKDSIQRFVYSTKYENNDGLVDIFTFISKMDLAIDIKSNWFQDLWYPLSKKRHVLGSMPLFEWLGYEGEYYAQKRNFKKLLDNNIIPYEEVDSKDDRFIDHPSMKRELATINEGNLVRKRWIVMDTRNFKKAVMRLNTKNAEMIRDYYLNLEDACLQYTEYHTNYMFQKGEYLLTIKDTELSQKTSLLAIKDNELKEEKERAEQAEEENGELKDQLEQAEGAHKLQERYTNKLRDIVTVMKSKQKDQIVYIATTKTYAKQNRFKVGGVKSRSLLRGRLSTYNTGRPAGDKMYYAYISETTDYQHLEQRIKRIIGDHIDTNEMYNLHYDSLQPLVEYLSDRFDEEVTYHKSLFETLLKDTLTKEPRIPDPILLNGAEFRKIKNGQVVSVQLLDFDEMSEDDKADFVKGVLEEFSVFKGEASVIERKEFESYLLQHHKTKFNKRSLWSVTKVVANKLKKRFNIKHFPFLPLEL
jgi:prophage antirepressor-like protein